MIRELSHMSLFLPHKLKVLETVTNDKHTMVSDLWRLKNKCWVTIKAVTSSDILKPIFNPISYLENDPIWRKFIETTLEQDVPKKYCGMYTVYLDYLFSETITPERIQKAPWLIFEMFIASHVDVFGYIDKGLAIDKVTFKCEHEDTREVGYHKKEIQCNDCGEIVG